MCAGAPTLWKSAMQSEIALSSTESKLIRLSMALRDGTPILRMLEELQEHGFKVSTKITIQCKAFEDNNGAMEISRVPKMRPRTRHINCKHYHFMDYTSGDNPQIQIERISSKENPADTLTKPNELPKLQNHHSFMWGW